MDAYGGNRLMEHLTRYIAEFSFSYALIVFVALLFTDYVWAEWSKSVADGNAKRAAINSIGTVLASGFAAISYVHNPLYLIPAGIGAFIGTYVSVKRKNNR